MIIRRLLWPALCALGTGATFVHAASSDGTPSASSTPRAIEYRSVFDDYRAYRDPSIADWRTSNDTVGRLKGHAGHVSAPDSRPESEADEKGPVHRHHGGRR